MRQIWVSKVHSRWLVSAVTLHSERERLCLDFRFFVQSRCEQWSYFNLLAWEHHLLVLAQSKDSFDRRLESCLVQNCEVGEVGHAAWCWLGETDFVGVCETGKRRRAVISLRDSWLVLEDARSWSVDFRSVALVASDVRHNKPIWASIEDDIDYRASRTHAHFTSKNRSKTRIKQILWDCACSA